jgi:hypothetical protein
LIHLVIDYRGIDGGTLPARAPVATAAAAVPCSPWFKTTSNAREDDGSDALLPQEDYSDLIFLIG